MGIDSPFNSEKQMVEGNMLKSIECIPLILKMTGTSMVISNRMEPRMNPFRLFTFWARIIPQSVKIMDRQLMERNAYHKE